MSEVWFWPYVECWEGITVCCGAPVNEVSASVKYAERPERAGTRACRPSARHYALYHRACQRRRRGYQNSARGSRSYDFAELTC